MSANYSELRRWAASFTSSAVSVMTKKPVEPVSPPFRSLVASETYIAVRYVTRWTVVDRNTGLSVHENPDGEELTEQRAQEFADTLNRNADQSFDCSGLLSPTEY